MPPLAATIHVFTFKRGLLAAVGHDLRLSFGRFHGESRDGAVEARFDLTSLSSDGAVSRPGATPEPLPRIYTDEIERNARSKVLAVERYPTATWQGRVDLDRGVAEGSLALHGKTAPVHGTVRAEAGGAVAVFELVPSNFGIRPFRAMAGALRLEDRVRVEATVRWGDGPPPRRARFEGPKGPA